MEAFKSVKEFTFLDQEETSESLHVKIQEVADASYGLYVWPCAPVLAQYIWCRKDYVKDKNILEIGAGTALPGIVAAKCGANVTLSDSFSFKHCLEQSKYNATLNGFPSIPVVGISWGCVTADIINLPHLNIILASDCFYDTKDFEDIVMTMGFLLQRNPDAEIWCTYQVRSTDRSIEYFLSKFDMEGTQVPTPSMETVQCSSVDHTTCEIQLFILKLKQKTVAT